MPKEFKGNFECLGENTEKYITFSVSIKKEHDNGKTTTYKLKFIDSYRFMQDSLSNLVDNLSNINNKEPDNKFIDGMRWIHYHSLLIKYHRSIEVSQSAKKELENKFIDNMRSMMTSLSQSIVKVSEIDKKISHAALIEKFPNTHQLCNKDLNKFALLLRKGVYPYEYMNGWKRFKEESLSDKESC